MATSKEQPKKPEKTPLERILTLGAGVLGAVLGFEVLKGFFRHN
jgi:hypothetical protein